MQEMPVRSLSQEDALKKEMVTRSSILAWKIPWTRGAWWAAVHGVRHDLVTEHACILIKGYGLTTQIIEIEGWFDHPDN